VESLAREGHKVYKLADFVECGAGGENVSRTLSLLLSPIERTLIVEDEGAVRAFLSRRSELGNPQIKFVVLSRLPSEVPPLPEGVIVRPEAELCVRYLCSGARVTPDPFSSEGSVCFNYEGVVVRGATVEVCGDELSLLEIKHRIRQIESRESFLLSRKTQLEGRLASLGEFFSERGVTLETLQSKISLVRKDVDGLKAEEEWLVRERGDIERRLSLFDSEMEFCVNEEERLKGVLISSENALRNATSAMEEIRLKQASVDERLRDARESLFKLQNKESEAGVKVARLEEQLNAREKELREMECFLNNTTEEMEKNLSAVEDIRRKQKSLEDRIKEAEKRREDSLARIAAIVREREELSANLELLRTTVEQLGSRRDEIYRATEGQSQVEQNLALKDTALREQLQSLMRQASEMGFDVSSVSIDFDALELGGEVTEERLKTEIESVEHKISALGSINQTAAEEMEAVEGRLQFFSLQEADLTDAVKRLTSTIAKLDEHCKKKLEEVFEKVKTNFSELFRRLFNGGSAELSLTSENILEAGIEVMARPPCKKNSTIMQLSGGERAMCAIAFLFSIYKTRPSPVCLLDELDAPLDEMNVSSFISLLREFSQSTQFLVITHSKQTIAGMDDAIGVTMGTPGVSNIVSVSITEAAELAAQSL
ncbi:MAG: hypothetical protein N2234_07505, partial [Planctomycetota bacterium]|nr:hypothetical protein [Planctomycetota bacterium]